MVLSRILRLISYFLAEVNHIDKNNFDKQLTNILSYTPAGTGFSLHEDVYYLIKLHPTYGFIWEYDTISGHNRRSDLEDNNDRVEHTCSNFGPCG